MNNTESYDGSSWTTGGTLNKTVKSLAGAGASNTAALSFGGSGSAVPPSGPANNVSQTQTEQYNGTSWTTTSSMSTAKDNLAGCGTTSAALAFGGENHYATHATAEYN